MALRGVVSKNLQSLKLVNSNEPINTLKRNRVTKPSGAILPEPKKVPFGILGILGTVIPGLLIGATISKNIANFLEENDLFVPADDDDDDD